MSENTIMAIVITVVILGTALISTYTVIVSEGWPANPWRWGQHKRWQAENFRVDRISRLEHTLGYTPCSKDNCSTCKSYIKSSTGEQPKISIPTGTVRR